MYRQSIDAFVGLDDKYCAGKSMLGLGSLAHEMGDIERATSMAQDALALYRGIKVPLEEALALSLLGRVALGQHRLDTAAELLKQSLGIQQTISDAAAIATNLGELARLAYARGNPRHMAQLLAAADTVRNSNGVSLSALERESFEAAVVSARSALDDSTFQSAWATGHASSVEEVLRLIDTT
jgi:hypothetical protein